MEITFYYGGIMPQEIQEQINNYAGWDLTPDFDEE